MRIPKLSSAVDGGLRALALLVQASKPRPAGVRISGESVLNDNEKWMPLAAASQIMYDELAGTEWRTMADKEGTAEQRLDYLATCLVRNAPIEGRSPPSNAYRSIPSGDFDSGVIKGGGKYFQRYYESYLTFLDMRISVADFRGALERMKASEEGMRSASS